MPTAHASRYLQQLCKHWAHNLAVTFGDTGRAEEAITASQTLLTDQLRILGPDHPNTLNTRNNLQHLRTLAG